jgi:hypothetical protein
MSRHEKVESPPHTPSNTVPSECFQPSGDKVRIRAYEKYCARNGAPGDPVADWLEAERELVERNQPQARPQALVASGVGQVRK